MQLTAHPRLLLSRAGVEQMKQRIDRQEWAKAAWEELKRSADRVLSEPLELPPRGGNWPHWYACPTHGIALQTGREVGPWRWEHVCPVGGEVLPSDEAHPRTDYDGCVVMRIHQDLARAVRDMGLLYQVTGEDRYARRVREILLAYAERYLGWPLHTTRGEAKVGGGRVSSQTLEDSTWLISVCQGADMVWENLEESDRETIAGKLLLPAAKEVMLPHRLGVHNIQCWKNSAVGLVGFLLGEEELIRNAIHDPEQGYWKQMRQGVLPDGVWWEGSWGYHFYTLSALWSLTEAARNCGGDLYGEELKGMFDAPLEFAAPNLQLPAFNDSAETYLPEKAQLYELAFSRYSDPRYVTLLARSDRRDSFALWFGTEELPSVPSVRKRRSVDFPRSGCAVLARGEGERATWLCLKYGPHGGGHGHPDKLGFVLYARGRAVAVDPGSVRYGVPIQFEWHRTTPAHNTLAADQASQVPAEGRCVAFGSEKGVDFIVAEAGEIYKGLRFVRTAALLDENLLVFVDQIRADRERLLDLACHARGVWENVPAGSAWSPPEKPGYRHLRDATIRKVSEGVTLTVHAEDGRRLAVTLARGEPTEVITATGIGEHAEDRVPVVVFRRRAKETSFAWCLALDGLAAEIELLPVRGADGRPVSPATAVAARVVGADGRTRRLLVNPDGLPLLVPSADGPDRPADAPFAVLD